MSCVILTMNLVFWTLSQMLLGCFGRCYQRSEFRISSTKGSFTTTMSLKGLKGSGKSPLPNLEALITPHSWPFPNVIQLNSYELCRTDSWFDLIIADRYNLTSSWLKKCLPLENYQSDFHSWIWTAWTAWLLSSTELMIQCFRVLLIGGGGVEGTIFGTVQYCISQKSLVLKKSET